MSDPRALYDLVRARLDHEDGLIVQRSSWLLASQSFLFTAYAIVLNGQAAGGKSWAVERMESLRWVLPGVGLVTAVLILSGVLSALVAMRMLATDFASKVPDPAAAGLPPLQASPGVRNGGLAAPVALPVLFVVAWIVALAG
jgi:hypothetical protein